MNAPGAIVAEAKKRKSTSSGDETRKRITAATLETLKSEGIAGTSARAIARAGDFNQALIFYHFDSVNGAIVEAVAALSCQRMDRYRSRVDEATTLVELIDVAIELHASDTADNNMTVLTQAFAGAAGDEELGPRLYRELAPWSDMIGAAIQRVLGDSLVAIALPHDEIARMISALFLGIELLDDLDPERVQGGQLLETLRSLATLLEAMVDAPLMQLLGGLGGDEA